MVINCDSFFNEIQNRKTCSMVYSLYCIDLYFRNYLLDRVRSVINTYIKYIIIFNNLYIDISMAKLKKSGKYFPILIDNFFTFMYYILGPSE